MKTLTISYADLSQGRFGLLSNQNSSIYPELFSHPVSGREVLTRQDGQWELLSAAERLSIVEGTHAFTEKEFRLGLCLLLKNRLQKLKEEGLSQVGEVYELLERTEKVVNGEIPSSSLTHLRDQCLDVLEKIEDEAHLVTPENYSPGYDQCPPEALKIWRQAEVVAGIINASEEDYILTFSTCTEDADDPAEALEALLSVLNS